MVKFIKFFDMDRYTKCRDGVYEEIAGSRAVACLNDFMELNSGVKVLSVNHTISDNGDDFILVQVDAGDKELSYPRKNGQGLSY